MRREGQNNDDVQLKCSVSHEKKKRTRHTDEVKVKERERKWFSLSFSSLSLFSSLLLWMKDENQYTNARETYSGILLKREEEEDYLQKRLSIFSTFISSKTLTECLFISQWRLNWLVNQNANGLDVVQLLSWTILLSHLLKISRRTKWTVKNISGNRPTCRVCSTKRIRFDGQTIYSCGNRLLINLKKDKRRFFCAFQSNLITFCHVST